MNVADRAAGRAHAAGIVAARRVVAIVGVAVIVVVVIVVANMMDGWMSPSARRSADWDTDRDASRDGEKKLWFRNPRKDRRCVCVSR